MQPVTTQREIRARFWRTHPTASRKRVPDYAGKRASMFVCDTRVAFVDYIDQLQRAGVISMELAQRATLGRG